MYITKQGQAWDQIAKEIYGKESCAGYLMQSNPKYLNIFVFPSGIALETPEIPEEKKNMPPWR